jgi:hypothetical protein
MTSVIIENGIEVIVIHDEDESNGQDTPKRQPSFIQDESSIPKSGIERATFIESKNIDEVNTMLEKKQVTNSEYVQYHKAKAEKRKRDAFLQSFDFDLLRENYRRYKPSDWEYMVKILYGDDFDMSASFL